MGVIILLAFVLRVIGLGFGLPHVYHQDEPVIVNHAMAIGERGWNPHFFVIPSFSIYFLFILYGIFFVVGHLFGFFADKVQFGILFLKDPSVFYLIGRFFLGALFGTATVAILGKLGQDFFSPVIGRCAAFFLAISLLPAQHSHYIYADIPLTFFMTTLLYSLFLIFKKQSNEYFILAGLCLGLATATKYTAVYFVPPILLAYVQVYKFEGLKAPSLSRVGLFILSALVTYALMAPYTFLAWTEFLNQIRTQTGSEAYLGWSHHFVHSILNGTSLPFCALAIGGAAMLFRHWRREFWLCFWIISLYYAVNVHFSQPFSRYMMPLFPILCLLAALGWDLTQKALRNSISKKILFVAIAASLLLPTLYANHLFLKKDTRDEALEWMQKNVPAGAVIVVDNRYYAPHLSETKEQLLDKYSLLEKSDATKRKRLDLMFSANEGKTTYAIYTLMRVKNQEETPYLFQRPFVAMDINEFRKIRAEYLIVNYSEYHEEVEGFVREHRAQLELVKAFSPFFDPKRQRMIDPYSGTSAPDSQADLFSRRQLGPYLEIYKVKT